MAARFQQPRFSPLRGPLSFGEQKALTSSPFQQAGEALKAAAPPSAVTKGVLPTMRGRRRKRLGAFYGQ